jgi:hypothetical protein
MGARKLNRIYTRLSERFLSGTVGLCGIACIAATDFALRRASARRRCARRQTLAAGFKHRTRAARACVPPVGYSSSRTSGSLNRCGSFGRGSNIFNAPEPTHFISAV